MDTTKFLAKHLLLSYRDLGRITLVLQYKSKSVEDPAPDFEEVTNKFYTEATKAHLLTVGVGRDGLSEKDIQWLEQWSEDRKTLLRRVAFYERKLGIDRKTYSISGDLIGGHYYRG